MAHRHEVPQTPHYGSIDAMLLFWILIGRHAAWTGDLKLFNDLRGPIEKALTWMARYGDHNGEAILSTGAPRYMAWRTWDGRIGAMPSSTTMAAWPHRRSHSSRCRAMRIWPRPRWLTFTGGPASRGGPSSCGTKPRSCAPASFDRDFWLEGKGIYALALQAQGRPAAVVSSNPGQALWSGIADPGKARRTVERLMADGIFSGWRVRTLSEQERRYNPIGYHLGTVWPTTMPSSPPIAGVTGVTTPPCAFSAVSSRRQRISPITVSRRSSRDFGAWTTRCRSIIPSRGSRFFSRTFPRACRAWRE